MTRRRRVLVTLVALLALAATAVATVSRLRRAAKVCWLRLGDALASAPTPRQADGELLLLVGSDPDDRDALRATHGKAEVRGTRGALLLTAPGPGRHEVCTRRIPRDWSSFTVLRLELGRVSGGSCAGDSRPVPLRLALRLRSRPAWRETAWFRHEVYLSPSTRQHEVGLRHAAAFIDVADVRQLCLSLDSDARTGTPRLELRRAVLTRRWWADRPAPPGGREPMLAVLGDCTRLRRADPLPASPAGPVHLTAARNETVAFQVVLRGPGSTTRVTLPALAGPDGASLTAELFRARFLRVRQPSSAMYGPGSPGPGDYPDPLVLLPDDGSLTLDPGNNIVWIDILVAEDAVPGDYRGQLRLGDEMRPVQVQVLPLTLPHEHRNLVMVYYSPHLLRQVLGVKDRAFLELDRAYHRLVHAHGAYLASDPPLEQMTRYLPMLDGSLYRRGPGRGQGAPYWPVDLSPHADDRTRLQAAAGRVVGWFRRHAPRTRPFVYLADEPASLEDYQRIRRLARWIHAAPPPGNQLPVMVTEQVTPDDPAWPDLVGAVDYWVSPGNFPEPARARARRTRERFFTYNGLPPGAGRHVLDASGISLRTWGWIAYLFAMDMWFYWQGTYYRDEHNGGPLRRPEHLYDDPITFDQRRTGKDQAFGNGDGLLVYPPLRQGGAPVPSMRLKVLRRGVQDRLYLLLANRCGKGKQARSIARELIPRALGEAKGCPTAWPEEEAPWQAARRRLQALVAGCVGD